MRIGVFGGSFDPVHVGHLVAGEAAADRLRLDRLHFIPAGQQPLKAGGHAAPAADRVAMLELAIADNPRFRLDRREVDRPGPSFTIDTLRALRAECPDDSLFLLVGADAARDLARWRDAASLPALAEVVVLTRPGVAVERGGLVAEILPVPAIEISATLVRQTVHRGESIRYLVPAAVAAYIASRGLYGSGDSC